MSKAFASLTLLAALAAAAPALAQPAAVPAATPLGGPAIPGVCLLSVEAVVANAKIGLAANARLKQIAQEAENELNADRGPLQAEVNALKADRPKLKEAQLEQREMTLKAHDDAFVQKSNLLNREIEATREKAFQKIIAQAQEPIDQIYKAHNCGLLLNRNSVLGGNMAGDLTPDVVKALDAKVTTITFDREILAQAAAPSAAPPAAARK